MLLLTNSRRLIYGREKGGLWKLNTAKIERQRLRSFLPEAWFTPDGTLWLDNGRLWRVDLSAPA